MASKHVLITGITGSLGAAVATLFLRDSDTLVYGLIRAKSEEHLRQRVATLFAYWGEDVPSAACERFIPLRGDTSEDQLGLPGETYTKCATTLTHIVHCAASVKLNMDENEAAKSSLIPTQNIIFLARECSRQTQFQKLEYVSTVGVAGRMQGIVPERPLPEIQEFHNNYERYKAKAETRVLEEMANGLSATIHRPSMIIGDSVSGKIMNMQGFYFLSDFLSGMRTLGILPQMGALTLDLVPADYAAQVIHWASGQPSLRGAILHLCSGPDTSIPVYKFIQLVRECYTQHGIRLPSVKYVAPETFARGIHLLAKFAPAKLRKAVRNLFLFIEYMHDEQKFDNRQTGAILEKAGIIMPNPEHYLPAVFRYYLNGSNPRD